MELSTEQKLERLLITDVRMLEGKRVERVEQSVYLVDGVRIARRGNELLDRFMVRMVAAICNQTPPQSILAVTEQDDRKAGVCIDCGAVIYKQYTRCRACANKRQRTRERVPCRICGVEKVKYSAQGGGPHMLNASGVCQNCRDEYRRRIVVGEMTP